MNKKSEQRLRKANIYATYNTNGAKIFSRTDNNIYLTNRNYSGPKFKNSWRWCMFFWNVWNKLSNKPNKLLTTAVAIGDCHRYFVSSIFWFSVNSTMLGGLVNEVSYIAIFAHDRQRNGWLCHNEKRNYSFNKSFVTNQIRIRLSGIKKNKNLK